MHAHHIVFKPKKKNPILIFLLESLIKTKEMSCTTFIAIQLKKKSTSQTSHRTTWSQIYHRPFWCRQFCSLQGFHPARESNNTSTTPQSNTDSNATEIVSISTTTTGNISTEAAVETAVTSLDEVEHIINCCEKFPRCPPQNHQQQETLSTPCQLVSTGPPPQKQKRTTKEVSASRFQTISESYKNETNCNGEKEGNMLYYAREIQKNVKKWLWCLCRIFDKDRQKLKQKRKSYYSW